MAGSYEAIAAGEVASLSETVERITGAVPLALEAYVRARPELLAPLSRGQRHVG